MSNDTAIISVASTPFEVTFYEDRARVVRRVRASVPAGVSTVEATGFSLFVDDPSLAVTAPGGVEVAGARVKRRLKSEEEAGDTAETRKRVEELQRLAEQQIGARKRMAASVVRIEQLERAMLDRLAGLRNHESGDDEWSRARDTLRDALDGHLNTWDAQNHRTEDALEEVRRFERILESTTRKAPELEAVALIQLEAEQAGEIELEVAYFVPCALWRPAHTVRLTRGGQPSLEVVSHATVWQATGESWSDVACRFSTARPAQASSPPLLSEDELYARPKTDHEKRIVDVEAREVTVASTGADSGPRKVAEMPGVDDGGEPVQLEANANVTIPSTGDPFRVEFGRVELPCEAEIVAFPAWGSAPHLRARATWKGSVPLLAGPVTLFREQELAGQARVGFVPSGEVFELGMGLETSVSVRRAEDEERKFRKVARKNRVTRKVTLYLSNLSSEAREIVVVERIPVSEIDDVEVELVAPKGVKPDKDGMLELTVALEPNQTAEHELEYRVEYGTKVNLGSF